MYCIIFYFIVFSLSLSLSLPLSLSLFLSLSLSLSLKTIPSPLLSLLTIPSNLPYLPSLFLSLSLSPSLSLPYSPLSLSAAITKLTTTYASVTLYRNHTIKYSARVYSTIACQMEFYGYPMDVQTCAMIMQSCEYVGGRVGVWVGVCLRKECGLGCV